MSTTPATEFQWAEPMLVDAPADCKFYHWMEFPDGSDAPGDWDLRGRVGDYSGHVDVAGKRLLDMGAASGFMSFAFEERGAEVVSADVAGGAQYTKVPYHDDIWKDRRIWLGAVEKGLEAMKRSYWYGHRRFKSKARVYYGDLIDLPEGLGRFDIGFIGQIMVHNRDPLGLMQAVAERTTETLVISEGMEDSDQKVAHFIPSVARRPRPHGWLRFSTGALTEFLDILGFEVVSKTVAKYKNVVHGVETPITTLVARRVAPLPPLEG